VRIGVGRIIRDHYRRHEDHTVPTDQPPTAAAFLDPGSASIEDFECLDLRIGRVIAAEALSGARKPAYRLRLDFGPAGERGSSAQLTRSYPDPTALVGRLVVAVVNLPPRRVAGFTSEVLVLGALAADGQVPLLGVDEGAEPGQRVG
jgi:tRNA-binding protein